MGEALGCREEVRFPSGPLTLAGEWFRPPGEGPVPAVVVVRGSGPSSRGNVWTESIAGVLVQAGVGVLIPDKRGSGDSDGDWRRASFGELAEDALSAVRYLSARPEVDARHVGLMGLSQGGQIVPIAGARSDSVAFLINVVGAAVPFMTNVRYEMLHTFQEEGLSGSTLQAAMTMVDTAIGHVQNRVSWEVYIDALRRTRGALGDELTDAYFISDPAHWRWEFFRRMSGFDPADWWRRVDQPTLVLLGGDDPNTDSAETARRIREAAERSGNEDVTVRVFDGLGHSLWRMTGPMSEHGLDVEVRRALEGWIHRMVAHG